MSGIHSSRLAASKAHRRFVDSARESIRKLGLELPSAAEISPTIVGARPLPFPVPPALERALGYRGDLRFVQFGFVPSSRQFAYCDGGDDVPSDESLWMWFLRHPVISPHLPQSRYPTLYGVFPPNGGRPTLEEVFGKGEGDQSPHCLLLDRQDRKAYLSQRGQTMILFAAVEPESGDHHTVFVDGLLMSPGTEDYRTPPPAELVDQFRRFLDELEIARNV